jgi:adenosine deaminase
MRVRALAIAVLLAVLSVRLPAGAEQQVRDSELRAAKALEAIRGDPLALYAFLKRMPKGADLHNHLDGAVYAETFIRVGGEDGLCVDPVAKSFTKSQPIRSGAEPEAVCEEGDIKVAEVAKTQKLYDGLVVSFSMRGFVPSEGESGHDHFFETFAKFGGTDPRHTGEFLNEVSARAAAQNEQYLELMETPTWNRLNTINQGSRLARGSHGFAQRAARQGLGGRPSRSARLLGPSGSDPQSTPTLRRRRRRPRAAR